MKIYNSHNWRKTENLNKNEITIHTIEAETNQIQRTQVKVKYIESNVSG